MKGTVYIITYFYWQDSNMVIHSFVLYSENNYTLTAVEQIAKDRIEYSKEGIHGYYITKEKILASNI